MTPNNAARLAKIAAAYVKAKNSSRETNDLHIASSALLGGLLAKRWTKDEMNAAIAAAN